MVVPEMEVLHVRGILPHPNPRRQSIDSSGDRRDPLAWPPHARRIVDLRLRAPCRRTLHGLRPEHGAAPVGSSNPVNELDVIVKLSVSHKYVRAFHTTGEE